LSQNNQVRRSLLPQLILGVVSTAARLLGRAFLGQEPLRQEHFESIVSGFGNDGGDVLQNPHISDRLMGIQKMLIAAHQAGGPLSSASKGAEREYFIKTFLSQVFPPPFRFGHGDITDALGRKSGQLDVVVEYPFLPSLPVSQSSPRLYLAEGVGAALEVKSDVAGQWDEVVSTALKLSPLERKFGATLSMGPPPQPRIPLFAVGYSGWKQQATIKQRLGDAAIDGILVIDSGLFEAPGVSATGPWSLWALISLLHNAVSTLKSTSANPLQYAV
jgi:hypothetical protein